MPDPDPPRTPNWADYIDSLHVFNPQWLVRARRASGTLHPKDEKLEGQSVRTGEERTDQRPATDC
jgi:hypothetical protein